MEQHGVEDAGHRLIHLSTLHRQLENLSSRVHPDLYPNLDVYNI